ncbi:TetR family transcriptional regulator C-terminal domain-containing protein [Curtobacterium sp. MCPF17_002]|uniref:TetR/AcrR family transcriptional regulator n=1 Tax=Curtobacterium sp. MCPF17_002 TaxID=2175645 RepID=UPI000DAA0434|nr:TetR family transcriptional regulator C-terminal domain-containing protein [Curtobacterium sp. MCPF17_002]WIB77598.1 TetR family transcriptional regulator C-terminal domain-containing protein [Curtobacterium sp. MCPF17_002]
MPESDADLRARIVTGAIEAYRASDFHTVGPAEVAVHAEVAEADVHRAYPMWELLVVAVMDRWNNGSRRALWVVAERSGAVAYLRARLEAGIDEPALVRLRTALLSAASNPEHPAAGWFRAQYTRSFDDVTLALVRDVVAGREPRGTSPRHAAEQLVALYEGLQLQSMVRDDHDPLPGFDRAVARMRAGWAAVGSSSPSTGAVTILS